MSEVENTERSHRDASMDVGINLEKCRETNSDGGLPLLINEFYSGLLNAYDAQQTCQRGM